MKKFLSFFLILIITNLSVYKASSQTQSQKIIKSIKKSYNALNYQQAELKAKQALINYHQFSTNELVELHKYLALIYYAQGEIDPSQKQFKTALSLKPDLSLSPLYVSPKIIEFFNRVKTEYNSGTEKEETLAVKYIPDKRFGASLRSLALPGWGQIYKGEKKKGVALISLWAVSIGGLLVMQLEQSQLHQEYLDAREPENIASKYDRYNSYYKARNSIAVFTAVLWLYAHIDAALKKENSPDFSSLNTGNFITPHIDNDKTFLSIHWQFRAWDLLVR